MITAIRKNKTLLKIKQRLKLIKICIGTSKYFSEMFLEPNRWNKKIPFGSIKPKHQKYKWGKSKSELNEEINELAQEV